MRNTHGAKKEPNYAGIMLDALKGQLCSKLCWHNIRTPSHGGSNTRRECDGEGVREQHREGV